jgi:hypothetical protein
MGLRHDQRRGLRMRRSGSELHRRKSCGGKQRETKICHDGLGPWKISGNNSVSIGRLSLSNNEQI